MSAPRRHARMILQLCVAIGFATQLAGAQTTPADRFPAELDAYIQRVLADGHLPGIAIAVVRNDSVLVAKGYGVRELGKPHRVDAKTVFDVASLSKSFTAT